MIETPSTTEPPPAPEHSGGPLEPGTGPPGTRFSLLFALTVSLFAAIPAALRIRNYDFFWHLATGRWIAEHRAIPNADPFSFTAHGLPWIAVPWLADLGLYGTYVLGGIPLVIAANAAAASLISCFLVLAARELSAPRSAILMTVPFFVITAQERLSQARPETFGFVALAAVVWLAVRFWKREDKAILTVPIITIVWLQAHAGSVLVVPVTGALLFACVVARTPRRRLWQPIVAFVGSLLPFVVTRAGRETVQLGILCTERFSPVTLAQTSEWRPPVFSHGDLWIPLLVLTLSLLWASRKPVANLFPLLLSLLGAYLASRSNRHIGPALVLAFPLFAAAAAALRTKLALRTSALLQHAVVGLFCLGLPLTHLAVAPVRANRTAVGLELEHARYPVEVYGTLVRLPPGRTMNDYHLGGYLIWSRVPGGVFWDGRNVIVYPDSMYAEALEASQSSLELEALADRWNIAYGLGPQEGMFGSAMMQSPNWFPVHHGLAATLFVRRKSVGEVRAAGIEPFEFLRAQPDEGWMQRWYEPIFGSPRRLEALGDEVVRAARMTPDAPVLQMVLEHARTVRPDIHAKWMARSGGAGAAR